MKKIKIMINGMPGNMAKIVAGYAISDERFEFLPYSLTGPDIEEKECLLDSLEVELISPDKSEEFLDMLKQKEGPFIIIDYTHPSAVNSNADLYCNAEIPFIMGTTGGDRELLEKRIGESNVSAVVAPNMAKQIVGFQAMLEFAAENFPLLFANYKLTVKESHQSTKADTSGTAKAIISCFEKLGADFSEKNLHSERSPLKQKEEWKIPVKYLDSHGWHTYTLVSENSDVKFSFTHNVCGRYIYADGTLDAVCYLSEKIENGSTSQVFNMIDVLKEYYINQVSSE